MRKQRFHTRAALIIEATFALGLLVLFFTILIASGSSEIALSQTYEQRIQGHSVLDTAIVAMQSDVEAWLPSRTENSVEKAGGFDFQVEQVSETLPDQRIELTVRVTWSRHGVNRALSRQIHLSALVP